MQEQTASSSGEGSPPTSSGSEVNKTTGVEPQGFDRLLDAGFTRAEVTSLRADFVEQLRLTRTPDQMPEGAHLTRAEEAWLDASPSGHNSNNANEAGAGGEQTATATVDGWGLGEGSSLSGLDDMFWGNMVGFFGGLTLVGLFLREEGVWSRRRQIAVCTGLVANLVIGFLRMSS